MKGKAKAARKVGRANESCTARNLKIFLKLLVFMDCPIVVQSRHAPQSFAISRSLLKLLSIMLVMPSSHLILCRPLLLPSIFRNIKVFSNELALRIKWPNYWSFSICPSNEYSQLISFRIGWFDLLAVQGTLKSITIAINTSSQSLGSFCSISP